MITMVEKSQSYPPCAGLAWKGEGWAGAGHVEVEVEPIAMCPSLVSDLVFRLTRQGVGSVFALQTSLSSSTKIKIIFNLKEYPYSSHFIIQSLVDLELTMITRVEKAKWADASHIEVEVEPSRPVLCASFYLSSWIWWKVPRLLRSVGLTRLVFRLTRPAGAGSVYASLHIHQSSRLYSSKNLWIFHPERISLILTFHSQNDSNGVVRLID